MHILTKVFVLFASILSVLMAALAISYTANAERIVAQYNEAEASAEAAKKTLSSSKDIFQRDLANKNAQVESLRQQIAELAAELREIESRNAELVIAERRARGEADAVAGRITQLGVATETQAKIIDSYRSELQDLRTAELRWREQKLDLEDELADQESRLLVYEQQQRSLREQLSDAQREIQRISLGGGITGATASRAGSPTEIPGRTIRGVIDGIRSDANGETLVQTTLGRRDRVSQNNKLYVVRNGVYLGDLVVESADTQWSVCRVLSKAGDGVSLREGDEVVSQLN